MHNLTAMQPTSWPMAFDQARTAIDLARVLANKHPTDLLTPSRHKTAGWLHTTAKCTPCGKSCTCVASVKMHMHMLSRLLGCNKPFSATWQARMRWLMEQEDITTAYGSKGRRSATDSTQQPSTTPVTNTVLEHPRKTGPTSTP